MTLWMGLREHRDMRVLLSTLFFLGFSISQGARASELRTVLLSSAYGAGAGALVGVTALAFSDNPGQNLSLVARGASLGLYVGLGVGIYLAAQESKDNGMRASFLITPDQQVVPGALYSYHF